MKQKLFFLLNLFFISHVSLAVSFIEEIYNDTNFVFDIIGHTTNSSCGLLSGDINLYRIHPFDTFKNPVIMHFGDSVTLRPVAYFDSRQQEFIWFIDRNGIQHDDRVEDAYQACLYNGDVHKFWKKDKWLQKWVGGDLIVTVKKEIHGYMLHVMHAATANYTHIDHAWVNYSQGVYSDLGLHINLTQSKKKGIIPEIQSVNSRGVVCHNGEVTEITSIL